MELTSTEACDRLGVRPQTLYAYVSRGLLTPRRDGRRSFFPTDQIETLAQRTARGRRPGRFELNIETAITLLDPNGRLLYRGVDVLDIAGSWPYERVAGWLLSGDDRRGADVEPWRSDPAALAIARRVQRDLPAGTRIDDRLRVAVTTTAACRRGEQRASATETSTLVATIVEALPLVEGATAPAADASIAARLWPRVSAVPATPARVGALDVALSLLADHELAASTLAARVAASTWSDVYEVVLAGLATLSGPLHCGSQRAMRELLADASSRGLQTAIDGTHERYGGIPGMGHPVYRDRDPRADALLAAVRAAVSPARMARVDEVVRRLRRRFEGPVNADLALAALAHLHRMVDGAGEVIFAVARTAGWVAHGIEESPHGLRFRPRAVYVGPRS